MKKIGGQKFCDTLPVNSKNRKIWPSLRQSFHFPKITSYPKKCCFVENLQIPSFYYKKQMQKENLKWKTCLNIFLSPPKWAKLFLTQKKDKSKLFGVPLLV